MEEKSKLCLPKELISSRSIAQHWLQLPCLYRVSADLKTVSCLLHSQWHLSQTKFRTLNSLLTVSQLVSQPWRLVRPLLQAVPARQDLGMYLDIVMAPQPLGLSGPMAQDHLMTTETQDAGLILSLVPEDEQARSAILLRFPCEQDHKGITKWINTLWEGSNMPAYNKRVRIHCKAGSVSARLVFETRAKCQDFVARFQDDGIAYEINSPFCCAKQLSRCGTFVESAGRSAQNALP